MSKIKIDSSKLSVMANEIVKDEFAKLVRERVRAKQKYIDFYLKKNLQKILNEIVNDRVMQIEVKTLLINEIKDSIKENGMYEMFGQNKSNEVYRKFADILIKKLSKD